MVDYESGTAAWDIGMVMTRHNDGRTRGPHGDLSPCARVLELRRTAGPGVPGWRRLDAALAVTCTCGAGDSRSERTSLGKTKESV